MGIFIRLILPHRRSYSTISLIVRCFIIFKPYCFTPRSNKEWLNRVKHILSPPVISAIPILATNSYSTFLSLISEQLFYYPLLTFLIMKCRKVEMQESAAHRISLLVTFAAHHFLCADQLPPAGRFHCAD